MLFRSFTSILSNERYHNTFQIREKETNDFYFEDLELHTIELKKFCQHNNEELSDIVAKVKNALDMWVAFLTRHDLFNKDHLPASLDTPALKKALEVLEIMNFAPEERQAYEERLKWFRIETNTLKKYESKGFEKGLEEGRAEGLEEGRAEGLEEGIEKGKLETFQAITLALSLFKEGKNLEQISQLTGLSLAELENLKKQIH